MLIQRKISTVAVDPTSHQKAVGGSRQRTTWHQVQQAGVLAALLMAGCATRITISTAGRQVGSDGITLRLARSGRDWLVSAVLFY